MSEITLLLSDLHLPVTPSPLRETFAAFLQGPARAADAVYILGDLFEYWIGDDVGLIDYVDEIHELRAASDAGVAIFFMHGNRDFLVGARFAAAAGVRLLRDPIELQLGGVPTLLSHGDLWCTADVGYQRWRRFARNRFVQHIFRNLSVRLRQRIGGSARKRSDSDKQGKPFEIMDVDHRAIEQAFEHAGIARIIHGHTHRPAKHQLQVGSRGGERIVLADWTAQRCEYLRISDQKIERKRL